MPDADNPGEKISVPAHEYPGVFVFYKMEPSGISCGLSEEIDTSKSWKLIVIDDDQRRNEFLKKSQKKLTVQFRNVPQQFGQLLAKIGYGHLLTALDPSDFRPICLPYILGEKSNVSYIVGRGDENVSPMEGIGYSLRTMAQGTSESLLLSVIIRLYANTFAPEYLVAVGEVAGHENVVRIMEKLKRIDSESN